ncbi:cadherin-23-like isoform X2 [Homarus americanus]|nr:cadherin-23-like isoform X2 [Homarus americanus]
MMVMENTPTTSTIGKITARDKDAGAHITFHIDWDHSEALKDNNLVDAKIDKWFTVDNDDSIPLENKYLGVLKVGQETPDREIVDTINLQIKAVDENTVVNNNSTTGHVKITIEDENDSPPEFVGSYEDQTVTENAGAGTKILTVRAKDPDLNDNVTISIEDETLVRLSQVTEENGIFSADLFVQSGSKIDREDIDSFDVVITITDLAEHTDSLKITINVIDLNDNPPVMVEGICGTTIDVTENESEGTYVTTVTATDADKEGAHKQIAYYLLNNQWQDEKSLVTPFSVDSSSGKVVVFLDKDRKVDREMYDTWTLVFRAHDGCEKDENNCTVLSTEDCHIYINVLDENDNGPENFSWSPEDDPLVVAESLRKDEEVRSNRFDKIYQFSAKDKDMPYTINSSITFEVHSFRAKNEEEELDWFVAESTNDTWAGDIHYYCTLRAKVNLTHQRGDYVMVLLAEDNGISPQKGNVTISMQVTDVNDNYPQFHFDTCVDGIPTVHMQENIYKSGDRVKCTTQNKTDNYLKFHVTDDDLGDNAKVSVDIDYDASTVEGADDKNGQKRSFKIDNTGENYTLMVLEQIDREKGSAYNLSVRAADNGQHSLQNSSVIRVIISNEFEFPPYFCLEGMCTQNISMVENEPDVTEKFKEAYDEDNKNLHPGDADYEEVYYEIIGGDINDFELTSNTETELKLKDKPKGLDREVTSQYSLTINVYNHKTPVDGTSKENNTLHVTIIVLDVNDNPPTFDDEVTFASFTASDGMGQTICTIQAQDLDENENFTYSLGNDFQWMETDITPTNPFRVVGDNNAANLILNFLPTGMNEGYCTFTVYVNDAVNHTGTTLAKVYAITNIFQLPVYFKNDPIEVKARQRHIEGVFKDVYGYPCIIDSIAQSQTDSGEKIDGQTTVLMHFINKETNSPVAVSVILDETDNDQVVRKLVNDLEDVDLNLMEIGARPIPEENNVQQLLILQVLLGVVSLVLGSLVFLLLTAYCLRTNSLERRVKVLSTNTFGSKSSELNRVGLEMTAIPGSNRFSGEGANPMYNMSEVDLKNDDSSSIGSGDSVLVGVEDNPEFKQNGIPNGYGNPTFSRSIDEVSVPAAFSGGTRTNPLLQLSGGGEDVDLADGLASFEVTIRRGSSGSEEESVNDNQLSNFTFGQ